MQDGVHGTYAEYTPVTAGKLMPVPDALSLQVATAALTLTLTRTRTRTRTQTLTLTNPTPNQVATAAAVQGLTAHYLVHDSYPLRAGQWCLVHAAAGGTGQWI